VKVRWTEKADLEPRAGHGFDFHSGKRVELENLIAVLRGFEWMHLKLDEVEIYIRPPDDSFDAETLADARHAIEQFMQEPFLRPGPISPALHLWTNG